MKKLITIIILVFAACLTSCSSQDDLVIGSIPAKSGQYISPDLQQIILYFKDTLDGDSINATLGIDYNVSVELWDGETLVTTYAGSDVFSEAGYPHLLHNSVDDDTLILTFDSQFELQTGKKYVFKMDNYHLLCWQESGCQQRQIPFWFELRPIVSNTYDPYHSANDNPPYVEKSIPPDEVDFGTEYTGYNPFPPHGNIYMFLSKPVPNMSMAYSSERLLEMGDTIISSAPGDAVNLNADSVTNQIIPFDSSRHKHMLSKTVNGFQINSSLVYTLLSTPPLIEATIETCIDEEATDCDLPEAIQSNALLFPTTDATGAPLIMAVANAVIESATIDGIFWGTYNVPSGQPGDPGTYADNIDVKIHTARIRIDYPKGWKHFNVSGGNVISGIYTWDSSSGENVNSIAIKVNGGTCSPVTMNDGQFECTYSPGFTPGDGYTIRATATSTDGKAGFDYIDLTAANDSTNPTITITSPVENALIQDLPLIITGRAYDEIGGSGISAVKVNGSLAVLNGSTYTYTLNYPLNDGYLGFTATAYDGVGNSSSAQVTVYALLDWDHDGMPDSWEVGNGLDKHDPLDALDDEDDDGLNNLYEYLTGNDPNLVDTDEDETPDAEEDYDEDGLVNGLEQVLETLPNIVDSDGDEISDGDEVFTHQTDPTNPDTDGDQQGDSVEIHAPNDGNDPHVNNQPRIYDLYPMVAEAGWTITVMGEGFNNLAGDSTHIVFTQDGSSITAEAATGSTTTLLKFLVPTSGLNFGSTITVRTTIKGLTYYSVESVQFLNPKTTSGQYASHKPSLTTIAEGDTIFGYIAGTYDGDAFKVNVDKPCVLKFSASAIDRSGSASQTPDIVLKFQNSLGVDLSTVDDNGSDHNPPPLEVMVLDAGTYFFRVESKNWVKGFYKVEFIDKVEEPYFFKLSPALGLAGDIVTLSGTGFSSTVDRNHVRFVLEGGSSVEATTITSYSNKQLVFEVPSSLNSGSNSKYKIHVDIVDNLGNPIRRSIDGSVLDYNTVSSFYAFDTQEAGVDKVESIGFGEEVPLIVSPGGDAVGHTGNGRGKFTFSAVAGQDANIAVQLLDEDGDNISGTKTLSLLDPQGNEVTPSSTDPWVFDALAMTGEYTIEVSSPSPGNFFRLTLKDETTTISDPSISFESGDDQIPYPGESLDIIVVQVWDGLYSAGDGIPVVFSYNGENYITTTDEYGQASAPAETFHAPNNPGTNASVTVLVGGVLDTEESVSFYVQDVSSEPTEIVDGTLAKVDLVFSGKTAVVGTSKYITVKTYTDDGKLVRNASVSLSISNDCLAVFLPGSSKTKNITTDAYGVAQVEIEFGEIISSDYCVSGDCLTTYLQMNPDDEYPVKAQVNRVTASVNSGAYEKTRNIYTIPDILDGASGPTPPLAGDSIYKKTRGMEPLFNYGGSWGSNYCVWMYDYAGNFISNIPIKFSSPYSTLSVQEGGYLSFYDDLQSEVIVTTNTNGMACVNMALRDLESIDDGTATEMYWSYYDDIWYGPVVDMLIYQKNPEWGSENLHLSSRASVVPAIGGPTWFKSDTSNPVTYRSRPYYFDGRIFEKFPDGSVKPARYGGDQRTLSVLFSVTTSNGYFSADPVPEEEPGSTLRVAVDSDSYAKAYWAPGPTLDGETIKVEGVLGASTIFGTDTNEADVKDTSDLVTMTRTDVDGEESAINNNGIMLAEDQYLNVHLAQNPVDNPIYVEIIQEATPGGNNAIIDPEVMDEMYVYYQVDDTYQFGAMPGDDFEFNLPIKPGNHGGTIRLRAFYYIYDESINDGVKIYIGDSITIYVANFRIKSIQFLNSVPLMKDLNNAVPKPEWSIDKARTGIPVKGDLYNDSISAPVAFIINSPLLMRIKYECATETSLTFFAECIGTDCPYGDIPEMNVTECQNLRVGDTIIASLEINSSVSASLINYKWQTKNIVVNGNSSGPTPEPIKPTYHRVYTLYNNPIEYGRNDRIKGPWLPILEMAYESLLYHAVTNSSTEDDFRGYITQAVFDSEWKNSKLCFCSNSVNGDKIASLVYSQGASEYTSGWGYLTNMTVHSELYLSNIIAYIEDNPFFSLDCWGINDLQNVFLNSLGINSEAAVVWSINGFMHYKIVTAGNQTVQPEGEFVNHILRLKQEGNNWYYYDSVIKHFKWGVCNYNTQSDQIACYDYSIKELHSDYNSYVFKDDMTGHNLKIIGPLRVK